MGSAFRSEESEPAALAVGALLAPVVACLRDDDAGVRILLDDVRERDVVGDVVRAAPAVARVYLRVAPPPGADVIVQEFPGATLERFGEPELVQLGLECLHVARLAEPVEPIARAVFVHDALGHGEDVALEGVVATCWWCALRSAHLRHVDPIEEAAAICRYVARVA
jgi:hypothetical protein